MRKMSKAMARKRLTEAKAKAVKVLWEADSHMTVAEMKKLNKIIEELHKAIRFNGLK